jgi:queuine tRNA-ribosyltransferase
MTFEFEHTFQTAHGNLTFPVYLPDATFGLVRAVDSRDLEQAKIQALVMNAFHMMQKPGSSTVQSLGGLHHMSGWEHPIITDSGGFQAYSLIRQNPKFGSMTAKGINFQPQGSERKFQLTPEKSIQLQMSYGADVVICLDDCTHVDASFEEQELSVRRTIDWAKQCRKTYDHLLKQKKVSNEQRPLIFGVVQGGGIPELRKQCAEALLEIGFDGYGFGGWPLDGEGNLLTDILAYTRSLIPAAYPMHALGIGHPYNVVTCSDLGYGIFDCAMPTRDARHGRLYTFAYPADSPQAGLQDKWLKYLYINDEEHIKSAQSINPGCDCLTCSRYSRGYLRHIFKMNDSLYQRLATIHNLRFMTQLTERIRQR